MTNHCTNCGFDNPEGMRFCGNCGARLDDAAPAHKPPATGPLVLSRAGLSERFQRAGLEAAGQRRSVTVLFADLSGYTSLSEQLDNEDVYFLIQEYLKLLANIVYRYDGFVDKYTGDGLMALFGAPVMQENNAELAVRAALDMHIELARLSARLPGRAGVELFIRTGLHAGSVIVGSVGSDLQMNYTAIGDTVNLASRLEQAARPGTILVSEAVYARTRALFEFTRLPPLALKGISSMVQTYQVNGVRERPGPVRGLEGLRPPMIGREAEFGLLKVALASLIESGRGQLALLTGEAGLGKTRLVTELKMLVPPQLVQVFEGHCLTYRRSVPFWVFLDLLRGVLGVTAYTPEPQVRQHLANRLDLLMGDQAAEALLIFEHVLGLRPTNPAADERLSLLEADQLRKRVVLAFRDWLVAEARRQPTMLVLEDLHWADDASLDLLQFLADSVREAPLLVIAISRPIEDGPLQALAERAGKRLGELYLPIALTNLAPDQAEKLLNHLLAVLTLPAGLRGEILDRAAGNPFYLEEILRMLLDRGILRRDGGALAMGPAADLTDLGVPETLKGLILARFDRLEPHEREFLQVAAAVGRSFSLKLAQAVVGEPRAQRFAEVLPRLLEREFILPAEGLHGSEYQFQHILVSDAIYSTLLARDRSELHGRIGAAIEELYSDQLDEQVELLARHYSASNRSERALHYLTLAGHKAARSFLNREARQYYEEALALLPRSEHSAEQEMELHSQAGDVLVFLGEYAAAREHFETALGLAEGLPLGQQVQARSNLQRKIGTTHERQGDYDRALACMNQALAALTAISSRYPVERARVLNEIGFIYLRRAQLDEAEKYLQRALWTVEPSSQPGVVASIYNRLGGVYFIKEDLKTASDYARRSLELRQETGDLSGVARMNNNLAMLEWRQGNWDEAAAIFTNAGKLHAQLHDIEGEAEVHANLGMLLTEKGELDEARRLLDGALRTAQGIGHAFLEALAYQALAYCALAGQRWQEARDFAARAEPIFREMGFAENAIDVQLMKGQAAVAVGDLGAAQAALEEIERWLQERGDDPGALLQQARAGCLRGRVLRAAGSPEEARQALEYCAERFQELDSRLDLGRALADLALLSQQTGDDADAGRYASQARAIFAQFGAQLDLQRIEEAGL